MLSLAKYGTSRKKEPLRLPDLPSPEWEKFSQMVAESDLEEACDKLISELTSRSKEQGKCIQYLRTLLSYNSRSKTSDTYEKCAETILRTLFLLASKKWSLIPDTIVVELITQGIDSVRFFPSTVIGTVIHKYCLDYMRENEDSVLFKRWIDMFVKCINVLGNRGDIQHEGDVIDGITFKGYIVGDICRMNWSKRIVSSLATIFEEIQNLELSDIDNILDKLRNVLKDMHITVVRTVLNQIVAVAGRSRPAVLLQICEQYFLPLKFSKNEVVQRPTGKKVTNSTENANLANKRAALGVVSFNFVDAARHCDPIVKEVMKRVKASIYDHTHVMSPFTLAVVLGMTSVDYLRASIVDSLRTAIVRSFSEVNLNQASKWYQDTRGHVSDEISLCFQHVIDFKSNSLEYTSEGLKDLGIGLLGADSLQGKYPMTLKKCHDLGTTLITSLAQQRKDYIGILMKDLLKPDSNPHIECLAQCLNKSCRAICNRNFHGRVSELMQHLPEMTVKTASVIIKALMPVLQISPNLLDQLMIVLRKTFWKSVESGRICVEVMCVVLSNSIVLGDGGPNLEGRREQSDDLLFSQCTQAAAPRSGSDFTALCLEVLDLAKRCFQLDCKVREQLYFGLHRVSRRNSQLTDIILKHLFTHASQYDPDLDLGKDDLSMFKTLFDFSETDLGSVTVKDELGFLVQCLGFVWNKSHQVMSNKDPEAYANCQEMINKWIVFGREVDVNRLEFAASAIVTNAGNTRPPETVRYVKNVLIVQTMQVIQALIEFIALASEWSEGRNSVKKLFINYEKIDKCAKEQASAKRVTDKTKKQKKAKKPEEKANESDNDAASVVSGSENLNATSKKIKLQALPKVVLYHLINLDSVCQMLREMYGTDNTTKALSLMKTNYDFENLLLNTAIEKLNKLKAKESIRERQRAPGDISNALTCLAETIWERLCRMEATWKEDNTVRETKEVVESRLQVVCEILEAFHRNGEADRVIFFNKYLNVKERDKNESCAELFKQWQNILAMVTTVFEGIDGWGNTYMLIILDTVSAVMPSGNVLDKIHIWSWDYIKNDEPNKEATEKLLKATVDLFLTCNSKCENYPCGTGAPGGPDVRKLARTVRRVLGDVETEEVQSRQGMWLITEDTAPFLLCRLCTFITNELEVVNTILGRLKAHQQYIEAADTAKMRENCIKKVDCLRSIATELVRTGFPAGPCASALLNMIPKIYITMSTFTEYLMEIRKVSFDNKECSLTSFKKLVAELGKDFKARIEVMIQHAEVTQRQKVEDALKNNANARKKGKNNNGPKVPAAMKHQLSKEGKLIPKMIYHIEKFEQLVIALSNKVDVNMLAGIKLSTARDFRIAADKLHEAFAERNQNEESRVDTTTTEEPMPSTSTQQVPSSTIAITFSKKARKRKQN